MIKKATVILFLCAFCYTVKANGISYPQPFISLFHALPTDPSHPSMLNDKSAALLQTNTTMFEERQVIDFEKREILFERSEKTFNIIVWQYRYNELDDYLKDRGRFALTNAWYAMVMTSINTAPEKKRGFSSLAWELPVQYPGWAKRILGKDPPKLSISGFEKIIVGYENTNTDVPGTNVRVRPGNNITFDQDNQFTIAGSVGRLININIKGSTKQAGVDGLDDPLKNFKIDYKGEGDELEDEIIQEVTAGYTNFTMPGTQLSGFSQSHEGLFGIKIGSKLGPLSLTGIASNEEGESQKTTIYPTGSGDNGTTITEKEFLKNKIFFLDKVYKEKYLGIRDSAPKVLKLQVWQANSSIANEARLTNENKGTARYQKIGKTREWYKLLVENKQYYVNYEEGWIRIDTFGIGDEDKIGIYMQTADSTVVSNRSIDFVVNETDSVSELNFIKVANQQSVDSTFGLMWRNVYQLPNGFDQAKFTLRITKAGSVDTSVEKTDKGILFSQVLGLTDDKKKPVLTDSRIFDITNNLIILPVFGSDSNGNEPFANPALGEQNNKEMYSLQTSSVDWNNNVAKFQITMSGSSRKTSFQLGFGSIMEGTEVLKVNGEILGKTTDYLIDYQTGQIDLVSLKARNASQIDVDYQSEALFSPKKKIFLGLHGETKLPFGENSLLGASVLYQDASARENVPKIRQEPYSKLLLDVNAKMDFEPDWMTKAVNMIPLIATDAKSTVAVEFEVAHSRTNPNTSKGKEAYIDDFEGSKEVFPLGLTETSWFPASVPPLSDATGSLRVLLNSPPAWLQYWYAPLQGNMPLKDSIFIQSEKKTTTSSDNYEPVLNLVVQPAPNKNGLNTRFQNPWAGIMTPIPLGAANRDKDKYLEFWLKNPAGGRLNIDLGSVSEDIPRSGGVGNGQFDQEDKDNTGVLLDSINIGLDGKRDGDEYYVIPNQTFTAWDTLRYDSDSLLDPRDPSRDNYQTYNTEEKYRNNFPYVNGTQDDRSLNTEDINGDGWQDKERYFRRYIDFDSAASATFMKKNAGNYMVPDDISGAISRQNTGWHLYRIPVNDIQTGDLMINGSPKWTDIKFVRIWWENIAPAKQQQLNTMQFARFQFVGNQWLEVRKKEKGSLDSLPKSRIQVSTMNTEDNAISYLPPPIKIQKDELGNLERESALSLEFDTLQPGQDAYVKKTFSSTSPLDLTSYGNISLMINGDQNRNNLWFFLRFGTDDSTYYESRVRLTKGSGDRKNLWTEMNIKLQDLSDLKRIYQNANGDTGRIDAISTISPDKILLIKSPPRRSPSFSAITWMALGVYRDNELVSGPYELPGNVWVNELKVNGIKELNGFAGRVGLRTQWADLAGVSLNFDYQDGSFRTMTDNAPGMRDSKLSGTLGFNLKLDKFLPLDWGVNLPFTTNVSDNLTRPELKPSSDINLTNSSNGAPDGVAEMYADLINSIFGAQLIAPAKTLSSHYQTSTFSRTFSSSFSKSATSKNIFAHFLLDRVSLDNFSYSLRATETRRGQMSETADRMDKDTSHEYHGAIKYDLSPKEAPKWTKWKPFENSTISWLPERFKAYEFSLLPTTLTFDLAEATYSKQTTIKSETRDTTHAKRFSLDHRMNLLYDPINILNLSYNMSVNRNLDDQLAMSKDLKSFLGDLFRPDPTWYEYGVRLGERTRTQGGSLRFDPSFLDWLSHSADYTTDYSHNVNGVGDTGRYLDLKSNGSFHLASTLNLAALFKNFSDGLAGVKVLAATFSSIEKAMDQLSLNSISLDYTAKSSLQNYRMNLATMHGTNALNKTISGTDFFAYQTGLSGKSAWDVVNGEMDDNAFGGMRFRTQLPTGGTTDQRTSDRSVSIKTNFNLPEPIDLQFSNISIGYTRSYVVTPVLANTDTTTSFPELSVSARTGILNKIPLVVQFFQSMQATSSFNYSVKLNKKVTGTVTNNTSSQAMTFAPLLGLTGALKKWPVNVTYSLDYSTKDENSSGNKTMTKGKNNSHKLGLRYEITQAESDKKEIKILMWSIPIKGRVATGLDGEYSTGEVKTGVPGEELKKSSDSQLGSVSPNISYDFTDNITGQAKYGLTYKKDISQTTTSNIFSLSVEIRF